MPTPGIASNSAALAGRVSAMARRAWSVKMRNAGTLRLRASVSRQARSASSTRVSAPAGGRFIFGVATFFSFAALRDWRLTEARRRGVPAFRILTNQALRAIAETRPASAAELLAIPGVGIGTAEKYGRQIYRIVEEGR